MSKAVVTTTISTSNRLRFAVERSSRTAVESHRMGVERRRIEVES